jgi:hypothetical protein
VRVKERRYDHLGMAALSSNSTNHSSRTKSFPNHVLLPKGNYNSLSMLVGKLARESRTNDMVCRVALNFLASRRRTQNRSTVCGMEAVTEAQREQVAIDTFYPKAHAVKACSCSTKISMTTMRQRALIVLRRTCMKNTQRALLESGPKPFNANRRVSAISS